MPSKKIPSPITMKQCPVCGKSYPVCGKRKKNADTEECMRKYWQIVKKKYYVSKQGIISNTEEEAGVVPACSNKQREHVLRQTAEQWKKYMQDNPWYYKELTARLIRTNTNCFGLWAAVVEDAKARRNGTFFRSELYSYLKHVVE